MSDLLNTSTSNNSSDSMNDVPDNHIAALDIGSNSFHFVYGRIVNNHFQILHREKYRVRLASGIDKKGNLTESAIDRAVDILEILAPTVSKLRKENFRAVATYTLRKVGNAKAFFSRAEEVFPFPIEVISGQEEARLIYQGVSHTNANDGQRLVIDIGGGSTELIVGEGHAINSLASLNMGCVSFTSQFFPEGEITRSAFNKAVIAAKQELEQVTARFNSEGWDWKQTIGCSGTIKAILRLIAAMKSEDDVVSNDVIQLDELKSLQKKLIRFGHVEHIDLPGLNENRRSVLCAGLSILIALFEMLSIDEMAFSEAALREGVIYEKMDQMVDGDVRERTIHDVADRFGIDINHAEHVEQLCIKLFKEVKSVWKLKRHDQRLLCWAARLHETGFNINTKGYHRHGYYILSESYLPGFNKEEQEALAWLVGAQRKRSLLTAMPEFSTIKQRPLKYLARILRLSVLLNQRRQLSVIPHFSTRVSVDALELNIDAEALRGHPLIQADLEREEMVSDLLGIEFRLTTSH